MEKIVFVGWFAADYDEAHGKEECRHLLLVLTELRARPG